MQPMPNSVIAGRMTMKQYGEKSGEGGERYVFTEDRGTDECCLLCPVVVRCGWAGGLNLSELDGLMGECVEYIGGCGEREKQCVDMWVSRSRDELNRSTVLDIQHR